MTILYPSLIPQSWYWLVGDSSVSSSPWSGAVGSYVPSSDPGYTDFIAGGNVVGNFATFVGLCAYINGQNTVLNYQNNAPLITTFSSNYTLTNPLPQYMNLQATSSGLTVTLPQENLFGSWPIGVSFQVINSGNRNWTLNTFDGNSINTIFPGAEFYWFAFTDNQTTGGNLQQAQPPGYINGPPTSLNVVPVSNSHTNDKYVANWLATSQLPGSTTNDSASAGNIGEFVSATVLTSNAVALTTGQTTNITSIALGSGDWDVGIQSYVNVGTATTVTGFYSCIASSSATLDQTAGKFGTYNANATAFDPGSIPLSINVGPWRASLASSATLFYNIFATFGSSNANGWGIMRARRVR